jgi:hypothetical protein
MNSIVTLKDGRKVDVLDVRRMIYDEQLGHPGNGSLKMRDGTIHEDVCLSDLDAIEIFRRELNEISHET